MKKAFNVIKIILTTLFSLYIIVIFILIFLSPKEQRFREAAHRQGQFLSQKLFDILIFQYSNYSDAYFEKSIPFNKRGDYAEGFKSLNKAVNLNPKINLGYQGWLRLVKLKDYQGCINDLKRLDSLTPNFVDAPWGENIHFLLGLSYKGLGNNELALKEFDKSINSEIDSSWVQPNLFLYKGIIYKDLEEYDNALDNFDACLKYNYNSPEPYFYKGLVYKESMKIDSAKFCLTKALELFNKGYKNKDVYNEIQDELYLSDILTELNYFEEQE